MKLVVKYENLTLVFSQGELGVKTPSKHYTFECSLPRGIRGVDGIDARLSLALKALSWEEGQRVFLLTEGGPIGFSLRAEGDWPSTWEYSQEEGILEKGNPWGFLGGQSGLHQFLDAIASKNWWEKNLSGKHEWAYWKVSPEMALNILGLLLLSDVKDR